MDYLPCDRYSLDFDRSAIRKPQVFQRYLEKLVQEPEVEIL